MSLQTTVAAMSASISLNRKTLLTVAGVVFGLTLLSRIPAALLYPAFKSKDSPLLVHGLQGAWSSGSLSGISLNGRLVAQDLHWDFKPLQLLLGRAAVALSGGGQIVTLEGGVATGLGGLRLTDLRFAGGIKALAAAAGYPFVPVDGRAGGEIEKLILKQGTLRYAEASLDLKSLAWTLARDPLLLGDFHADISTTPEAITATISSPAGPLEASGFAKLSPDQSYDVDILVKPKPGASEMLLNYLKTLGAPDPQGFYHLRQRGKL